MKIMVTGGSSMIGRATCDLLYNLGHEVDPVPHKECDLLIQSNVLRRFAEFGPEVVIHLAGYNGGIEWNRRYPERIFRSTTQIGMNVMGAAEIYDVKRVVSIISSCAYPDLGEKPMKESDFWMGLPNASVECHGLAKRFIHAYSRQISKESQTKCICAVVNNSYGPHDSFHEFKTKAVAALIKKFVEGGEITCWGSGNPRREFIYCKDVARALVHILFDWNLEWGDLVNVGCGIDYSIKELTELIAKLTGFDGKYTWDTSKPDGQMRKLLDSSLFKEKLGFEQKHSLEEGLKETIEWYRENKEIADERFQF